MSASELIIDTLSFLKIPVRQGRYGGSSFPYIIFFEVNAADSDFSDDENESYEHRFQVSLYAKEDTTKLKKEIRKALKSNFYDVKSRDIFDGDINQVIFECYFYEDEEED